MTPIGRLTCDPGANPGFMARTSLGQPIVHYKPEIFDGCQYEEAVFEAQHAATHLYRNGRRVAVSRKSQQGLSFTAGRLFERFQADRKYRIPVADWRGRLWPGATRLTKPVVLARLRAEYNTLVEHIPKTHQGDCLEAVGIDAAWATLTPGQKERYRCE